MISEVSRCPAPMLELAHGMADAVRPIITKYFRVRLNIDAKSDASPVTVADREAEALMREMIARQFPSHGIRGEEFGSDRPDAEWVWVLDPIDGTKSFISGSLCFGTQIALLHWGRPVLGMIDQPITGERWTGQTGTPTRLGATVIRTSETTRLFEAIVYTSAREQFDHELDARFTSLANAARFCRMSHDCYAAGLLALGTIDLLVEANVFDYDILPQLPIILGAGGIASDWDGGALTVGPSYRTVLISANEAIHAEALERLSAPTH